MARRRVAPAPVPMESTEPITIGRCTVTLNPENTIYPGKALSLSADVRRVVGYSFNNGVVWRYSAGWDTYHSMGHVATREEAIRRARDDLIRLKSNWLNRGDNVTPIDWNPIAWETEA